jgi:rRNA maturation endonuclease Nob1
MVINQLLKANFKKECPHCFEIVKAQAAKCMHCGEDLA